MRRIWQHAKQAAKEFWRGVCRGLGGIAIGLLAGWLGTRKGPIGKAATHLFAGLAPSGKTALTITLIALNMALVGLWISSEMRLYRLRRRVKSDMLTIGDLASRKDLIKALEELE